MNETKSKKVTTLLQSDQRDLGYIFSKAKELEKLNQRVMPYLGTTLAKYTQVANLTAKQLVLLVANGSVATQIRFQTSELLEQFSKDPVLSMVKSIHCKIRPAPSSGMDGKAEKKPVAPLSVESAKIMRDIAASIEDPGVRAALERIAGHTKK